MFPWYLWMMCCVSGGMIISVVCKLLKVPLVVAIFISATLAAVIGYYLYIA